MTTENLERRWEKLKQQLSETQEKVNLNIERKKLYDELHALQEVLLSYEKWIGITDKIPEESVDISKQLEQCKVGRVYHIYLLLIMITHLCSILRFLYPPPPKLCLWEGILRPSERTKECP